MQVRAAYRPKLQAVFPAFQTIPPHCSYGLRTGLGLSILCALFLQVQTQAQQDNCTAASWEAGIVREFNRHNDEATIGASRVVSDALLPVTFGVPALLWLGSAATANTNGAAAQRYAAETGLQSFVTLLTAYGTSTIMKYIVTRERPFAAYPNCITGYEKPTDPSFPSSHAAGTAALATALSLRYPVWYVIGPSVLYALATGISRMNLGVHYISDVLTGYVIGVASGILVNELNSTLFIAAESILPQYQAVIVSPSPTHLFSIVIQL